MVTFHKGELFGRKGLVKVTFNSPFLNLKGPICKVEFHVVYMCTRTCVFENVGDLMSKAIVYMYHKNRQFNADGYIDTLGTMPVYC